MDFNTDTSTVTNTKYKYKYQRCYTDHTQLQGQNVTNSVAFYQLLKVAVLVTYCSVMNHPKVSGLGPHTLSHSF